MIRKL
ncbi:hypothetical protein N7530_010460 [Penicillium desertorum]